MRPGRLGFILLAIYLIFIGGSAYYHLIFPVRVFHHVLITGLLGAWLLARILRGQGFPQTPLNLPILGAVVVWFITALTSIDPRMAFENLWFPLTHVLFFFILMEMFQRGRERVIMETVFLISALVVLLSVLEIASWYFGLGIIPGTQTGWFDVLGSGVWLPLKPIRLSLAMNISTLLAGFVAPLVTLAAAWAITTKRQDYRKVLLILSGGLLVVLILTFSRGGLLSIMAAAGTFGLLRLVQMPRVTGRIPSRALLGLAAFGGAAIVGLFVIVSITQERSGNRSDSGRLDMWTSAAEMTRDRLVTGVGPGVYGRAFRTYRDPTIVQDKLASAHNAYLNTAAETGLSGILVSLWLGAAFLWAWYRNWRREESTAHKMRLEAAFGALVGIGIHSLVDVFTITPIVLLTLVIAAFCITPSEVPPRPSTLKQRRALVLPVLALIGVIVYGLWMLQLDRAQAQYLNSFGDEPMARESAREAARIDPHLNLYFLQEVFLTGREASADPTLIPQAIEAYQEALTLEPTWDTGWLNLAALQLRAGDEEAALESLARARAINTHNLAALHWARLAESQNTQPESAIVESYVDALTASTVLPLADFWWETDLRRTAVEQYLLDMPLDTQYRVLAAHDTERAASLVPEQPQTAAEWWIVGEDALTVQGDPEHAAAAFGEAIARAPANSDYYASRARATWQRDPEAALRDLNIAELLGTIAEYPNAIRAEMADTPEAAERLRANALPPRAVLQEFAAVLYGRPAQFDVMTEMRAIGPGRAAMQPWYTVAEMRLANGDVEGAARAYRAILDYAPDEREAREALERLAG
jgi:O-antigen ligase/tetratricopeptide (TPR) repeat protein